MGSSIFQFSPQPNSDHYGKLCDKKNQRNRIILKTLLIFKFWPLWVWSTSWQRFYLSADGCTYWFSNNWTFNNTELTLMIMWRMLTILPIQSWSISEHICQLNLSNGWTNRISCIRRNIKMSEHIIISDIYYKVRIARCFFRTRLFKFTGTLTFNFKSIQSTSKSNITDKLRLLRDSDTRRWKTLLNWVSCRCDNMETRQRMPTQDVIVRKIK